MLDPHDRHNLLHMLRPPDGYRMDCAIGTTFSLDLYSLLFAPLGYTGFEILDEKGEINPDPLMLLDTIRRYAEKICIFCQAGQIHFPQKSHLLFGYLENSIVEVFPEDKQGVFHPKVWALRFIAVDDSEGVQDTSTIYYRILVLSRNLTFDRSWDTGLVLNGELTDRKNSFSQNNPLGDFFKSLPELAKRPIPGHIQPIVNLIESEVRRVKFELPPGFDSVSFHPIGIGRYNSNPVSGKNDRLLIVSPFVSEHCISELARPLNGNVLISRQEELEKLKPYSLKNFSKIYTLRQALLPEDEESLESGENLQDCLSGLHAKLYIADAGWNAHIWTGSANATDAAFNGNVEFLAELKGKKSRCGIATLLSADGDKSGFIDLLQEYVPAEMESENDHIMQLLAERLNAARQYLSRADISVSLHQQGSGEIYSAVLRIEPASGYLLPPGLICRCWPITLKEQCAKELTFDFPETIEFKGFSFEAITSFFVFEIYAKEEDKSSTIRFVLNLPIDGMPEGRREKLLYVLLKTAEDVLRFILLLLSGGGIDDLISGLAVKTERGSATCQFGNHSISLFEVIMKALVKNPHQLEQLKRLIDDLKKTPEGQSLLPHGIEQIWEPIWTVYERISK